MGCGEGEKGRRGHLEESELEGGGCVRGRGWSSESGAGLGLRRRAGDGRECYGVGRQSRKKRLVEVL